MMRSLPFLLTAMSILSCASHAQASIATAQMPVSVIVITPQGATRAVHLQPPLDPSQNPFGKAEREQQMSAPPAEGHFFYPGTDDK